MQVAISASDVAAMVNVNMTTERVVTYEAAFSKQVCHHSQDHLALAVSWWTQALD